MLLTALSLWAPSPRRCVGFVSFFIGIRLIISKMATRRKKVGPREIACEAHGRIRGDRNGLYNIQIPSRQPTNSSFGGTRLLALRDSVRRAIYPLDKIVYRNPGGELVWGCTPAPRGVAFFTTQSPAR